MNKVILFILAIFCLDKLYSAKKIGAKIILTIIKIFTGGGLIIWWAIDLYKILVGKYKVNPLDYLK